MVLSQMQANRWKKKLRELGKAPKNKWKRLSLWREKEEDWRGIKNKKWRVREKKRRKKIREGKTRIRKN